MQAINRVLRQGVRPESSRSRIPIVLPDWCEKGTSLVYISRSNGAAHTVTVEKIEERQQMVVIRFDSNRKIWKRVPFVEVRKFGDGTLRPLWKKTEVATVPERPKDFVDIDDDEEEAPAADGPAVDAEASKAPVLIGSPEEEPRKEEASAKRKEPAAAEKDAKAKKRKA